MRPLSAPQTQISQHIQRLYEAYGRATLMPFWLNWADDADWAAEAVRPCVHLRLLPRRIVTGMISLGHGGVGVGCVIGGKGGY